VSWREIVRTALRNVRRRPLRNGLATLGIVLGISSLVALLSLSAALQRALTDKVGERPLLTAIQVTAGASRAGEPARVLDGPAADALGRLPGVREAIPLVVVPATLRAGDRAPGGTLIGMSPLRAPYALDVRYDDFGSVFIVVRYEAQTADASGVLTTAPYDAYFVREGDVWRLWFTGAR